METKLTINGREFPIHYKMLMAIAENLPSGENYAALAKSLVDLDITSITEEILNRDILTSEELDNLWQKNDLSLKRKLADNETFRKNLTDAQAEEIMALNDPEMLKSIAYNCEELYPEGDERQAMRLSGKTADTFLKFLGSHLNTNVRKALARNPRAPAKFRPAFEELVTLDGTRLRASDFINLSPEALDSINDASLDVLKAIANFAEDIEDKEIRDKVIDILCSHPDPAVRLELAENRWAPFSVKLRLSEDPDEDVAAQARDNLMDN